ARLLRLARRARLGGRAAVGSARVRDREQPPRGAPAAPDRARAGGAGDQDPWQVPARARGGAVRPPAGADVRQGIPAHLRRISRARRPALRRRVHLALRHRRRARAAPPAHAARAAEPAPRDDDRRRGAGHDRRRHGRRHRRLDVVGKPRGAAAGAVREAETGARRRARTRARDRRPARLVVRRRPPRKRRRPRPLPGHRRPRRAADVRRQPLLGQRQLAGEPRHPGPRQTNQARRLPAARHHGDADLVARGLKPSAAIVVTGSELVRGDRRDLNGPFLASSLLGLGIEPARITIVGDEPAALEAAMREGLAFDLLVVSGGLGPTHDDRTVELLARAAGVGLELDPELERAIEARSRAVAERLRRPYADFAEGVRKQATVPAGAVVAGLAGTAPAFALAADGSVATVLPGPPGELQTLWPRVLELEPLRPVLARARAPERRTLRFFGVSEAQAASTRPSAPATSRSTSTSSSSRGRPRARTSSSRGCRSRCPRTCTAGTSNPSRRSCCRSAGRAGSRSRRRSRAPAGWSPSG